ncbi:hypothetical protein D3C71_1419500 [compost metagenome]
MVIASHRPGQVLLRFSRQLHHIEQRLFTKHGFIMHAGQGVFQPLRDIVPLAALFLIVTNAADDIKGQRFQEFGKIILAKLGGTHHRLDISQEFILQAIGLGGDKTAWQLLQIVLFEEHLANRHVEDFRGAELIKALMARTNGDENKIAPFQQHALTVDLLITFAAQDDGELIVVMLMQPSGAFHLVINEQMEIFAVKEILLPNQLNVVRIQRNQVLRHRMRSR